MNWKLWLKGLAAAAIGGATTSALSVAVEPSKPVDPTALGTTAVAGALVGLLAYLKQSPIPPTTPPAAPTDPPPVVPIWGFDQPDKEDK